VSKCDLKYGRKSWILNRRKETHGSDMNEFYTILRPMWSDERRRHEATVVLPIVEGIEDTNK
jgi:hypothetical protein